MLREIELVTQRSALEAREREREKVLRNEELAYQVNDSANCYVLLMTVCLTGCGEEKASEKRVGN